MDAPRSGSPVGRPPEAAVTRLAAATAQFEKAERNGAGYISQQEAGAMPQLAKEWGKADANRAGAFFRLTARGRAAATVRVRRARGPPSRKPAPGRHPPR